MSRRRTWWRVLKVTGVVGTFGLAVWLSVRHFQTQRELEALRDRKAKLESTLTERTKQLARASALQPNFKQLTQPASTARCREVLELVRSRYPIDPLDVVAASGAFAGAAPTRFHIDPCAAAQIFAEPSESTSQLERPLAFVLQWHERRAAQSEVSTLWLNETWEVVEMHRLFYELDKTEGRPTSTLVRAIDVDGALLERSEDPLGVVARVGSADGKVRIQRRTGDGDSLMTRIDTRDVPQGAKVHVMAMAGVWYALDSGISPELRRDRALLVWSESGRPLCTFYEERPDDPTPRAWAVGPECERRELRSTNAP